MLLGPDHGRQLEAALHKLVGGRRRQANEPGVPAFELGEPSARSDLGLQHTDVTLGEDDLAFDVLELGALRRDS